MTILLIDSSQETTHVALFQEGKGTKHRTNQGPSQSTFLLSTIELLLKESDIDPIYLDIIAVCNGPGSFTGTRVGVMAAKTLAYALRKPLISFHSLVGFQSDETIPVLAAKRDLFFSLDPEGQPSLYSAEELPKGAIPLSSPTPEMLPKGVSVTQTSYCLKAVEAHIRQKWAHQDYSDPKALEVCYLRSP